ncbi:hypothetical protein J5N97_028340 [Dioscorea zingiberensis]|uniref:Transcription factor TCP2 n=1 Tax=Dioscorea zingiberensis TaxID=325984 RepID=A0A9D5BYU3_9LILI|nr:hypothetical protein J5N97_028340 [Dioscorea zingiberensis]
MEEINSCKRPRSGADAAKLGQKDQQHQDDDDDDGEVKMGSRVRTWQHTTSSRIFRVSRASGGKDRHSKVLTAKGLRDRRVRLSVSTAIQFYDLQDRLGYDQPSKAVEWLIRAASNAIAKLPALDGAFPEPLSQHTGKEKQIDAGMEVDGQDDNEQQQQQQQQHLSLSKSGGSSTSETSKGSVLSLSRSESRIKARERARERTAKDNKGKDNQGEDCHVTAAAHHHHSLNSQSSFTELLTGGSGNRTQPSPSDNCIQKQVRQLPQAITTADYFGQAGLFGQSQKNHHHSQSQSPSPPGFSSQPSHFGNSSPMMMGDPSVQFIISVTSPPSTEVLAFSRRRSKPALLVRHHPISGEPVLGRVRWPPAALLRRRLQALRLEGEREELKNAKQVPDAGTGDSRTSAEFGAFSLSGHLKKHIITIIMIFILIGTSI